MAKIVDIVMPDGTDRALRLGGTEDIDMVLTRKMAWGSSWKILRMGFLVACDPSPPFWSGSTAWATGSYQQNVGWCFGVSSGSRSFLHNVSDRTCLGELVGSMQLIKGTSAANAKLRWAEDPVSGSFYFTVASNSHGMATGSNIIITNTAGGAYVTPDLSDVRKRRGIHVMEISQSGTNNYVLKYCGIDSGSVRTKNGNINFNAEHLKAALTSSLFPPTASGVLLNTHNYTMDYNTANYPLDSVFVGSTTGIPLYIFDWYIYKVL